MPGPDVSIFWISVLYDDNKEILNVLLNLLNSEHIEIEQTRKSTNGWGYDMSYGSDGPIAR